MGRLEASAAGAAERCEYRLLGAATPGFDLVEERRVEVEAAERVRTLYVAMTRAKDRLVMAGAWPRDPAPPAPPEQARTHLQLLAWRAGSPDLRILWQAACAGVGVAVEVEGGDLGAGVAWRFPDLRARRAAAASRMARPFGAAASEEAHAQLREELAAGRAPGEAAAVERRRRRAAAAGHEVALAAGAALHRALELWDLEAEPSRETERQRGLLPAYLAAVAAGEELRRALPRARELLDRFAAGGLGARLRGLGAGVLARELPVLLAPESAGESGPVAFVSGAVDLLYRDPGSGELVIADYKTDQVTGADLERRAAAYASQGAAYARAVQEALDLSGPPRFELWFVHAGAVVTVPPPG